MLNASFDLLISLVMGIALLGLGFAAWLAK